MRIYDIDFTEPISVKKERGIYLLMKNNRVVYVGQSDNIQSRVGIHLARPGKEFDSISYAVIDGDLNQLEADLIVRFQTKLNKGLPPNNLYATAYYISQKIGIRLSLVERAIVKLNPVWKNYYLISEVKRSL